MLQLDLFEGAILNAKQQTQLETFIDNQVVRSQNAKIKNVETEIALIDAGFVKGVDFNNTFKIYDVVEDVELGYGFDNSNFQVTDVKFIGKRGGISLLSKRYNREDDKIDDIEIPFFEFVDGKFECESLVGSYRRVKPATLLTKLNDKRDRAEYDMEATRMRNKGFDIALNTLRKKFPTAKFSIFTDYDRNYGRNIYSTERVKGQFDNGSYVTLDVHSNGKYKIVKKYDAEMVAMVSDQVMEFFANQNK
jgi:hypothetical protein